MSDDETEQQETEKEPKGLASLSDNAHFNLVIKVLAGVAAIVTIATGVSRLFGENSNIPFYEYLGTISVVSSMVFTVAGLLLYFIFIGPRNRRLKAENESLKQSPTAAQNYRTIVEKNLEIQGLESELSTQREKADKYKSLYERCQQSNENDKAQYKKDINDLSDAHKRDIHTMGAIIDQHRWLIERAHVERLQFPQCVSVEKFDYIGPLQKMPGLCFLLKVRNNSVFDLVIAETVEGYLQYHGEKWTGTRVTVGNDIGLPASGVQEFGIQYNLNQPDLDYFLANQHKWKDGSEMLAFVTENLRLMVRGARDKDQILPTPINLQDWRICDRAE